MSDEQWHALCQAWNGCCAYCGRPFGEKAEAEHIVPRSRGGTDMPENIIPACRSCNVKKRDLLLLEWVAVQYGLLIRGNGGWRSLRAATVDYEPYPAYGAMRPSWAPSLAWIKSIRARVRR